MSRSTSQAVPTSLSSRRVVRSASVSSNYSTTSTYDSKMDMEGQQHHEIFDLRRRLQECISERDSVRRDLMAKKEEIMALRDKINILRRELGEVTTSKGALNEVRYFHVILVRINLGLCLWNDGCICAEFAHC